MIQKLIAVTGLHTTSLPDCLVQTRRRVRGVFGPASATVFGSVICVALWLATSESCRAADPHANGSTDSAGQGETTQGEITPPNQAAVPKGQTSESIPQSTTGPTTGPIQSRPAFPTLDLGALQRQFAGPTDQLLQPDEQTMLNWTLGGRQFWGDVQFFHGWRIQQNVFTQHYRLLDERDFRFMWGTLEQCQTELERQRVKRKLPPMQGPGVILIHGLVRTSKAMQPLAQAFREAGCTVFQFDYPSTQVSIPESADYLQQVVSRLEGITELHFVVHSMGGLVIRSWSQRYTDDRVGRSVMLGTPNHGAEMADRLRHNWLLKTAFGPGARQLVTDPDGLIAQLPVPKFSFAVIAGARNTPTGWNPWVTGDDDGTVAVSSTRLAGAEDFMTVYATHTFMLADTTTVKSAVRFVKTGALRESGATEPIPADFQPAD